MSLGERIKEARKKAKLTQRQLGTYFDINLTIKILNDYPMESFSDLELKNLSYEVTFKTKPDALVIEKICKITHTEPNILLGYTKQIQEIKKEELEKQSPLENILYVNKNKIDSIKNLPIEKQQTIATAIKSILDMIDENDNSKEN